MLTMPIDIVVLIALISDTYVEGTIFYLDLAFLNMWCITIIGQL